VPLNLASRMEKQCGPQIDAFTAARQKLAALTSSYGTDAWTNAQNDYDQAQLNYSYCVTYTTSEKTDAQSSLAVAKNTFDQAQQTYNTLLASSGIDPTQLSLAQAKVSQAQTQLDQAQQNLDGTTLVAPMAGKVVYLAAGVGNTVDTSKFITVADVSHPTIEVSVDEADANNFTIGSPATIVFDSLPDTTFTGKVVQVDPQLITKGQYKITQGKVELDAAADQAVQSIPLGMNATVQVIAQQAQNVLTVPVTALKDLGNGQYAVFVVGSDGKLTLTPVKVGLNDGTNAEITSGLRIGEAVSTGEAQTTTNSSNSTSGNFSGGGGGTFFFSGGPGQ